jgi:hypothetical protein
VKEILSYIVTSTSEAWDESPTVRRKRICYNNDGLQIASYFFASELTKSHILCHSELHYKIVKNKGLFNLILIHVS